MVGIVDGDGDLVGANTLAGQQYFRCCHETSNHTIQPKTVTITIPIATKPMARILGALIVRGSLPPIRIMTQNPRSNHGMLRFLPFPSPIYISWIQFQTLAKPKRYPCPAFGNDAFPIAGLDECRWDGFKNGGVCSSYDNHLGLGGDCTFDAQMNKKRSMNCQETSDKECNLEIVKQFWGC